MTSDMTTSMPSLADKANAMLDQMETAHDSQQAPVKELTTVDVVLADKLPQPEQKVDTPTVETQTVTPPTINDDIEVTVKVDGKEQTVKLAELKNGYSRESTFTQRMQTLGQQRRQLEEYFTQQQVQLNQQAQAVQLAQQQLQQFNPRQQAVDQPKINPNDIATVGELQQALNQMAQQVQQARQQDAQVFQSELQKAQQAQIQELAVRRDQERFSTALDSFMDSEDGKLLAELNPFAADSIRFQTMQTSPDTTDEAIKNMGIIAKEWAQKVKGRVQTSAVRQEVVKAKTVMEPPVGTPAATISQPKPSVFKKDGGVDYNALFQRSLSLMD